MSCRNISFLKASAIVCFGISGCLLFFCGFILPVRAQMEASKASGGEFEFPKNICLTDDKRAEIQAQISESVEKLKAEGKLANSSPMFMPPSFIFPVRGNAGAFDDFGVHGISNFVDQNPAFPNQLLDYNCGARTYDQPSGYNHRGVDIFSFPFSWNKMDRNEVAIVAAADGTIVFKSDGNFDRSCGFNGNNWNAVYLQHSDGTISWYGHMKKDSLTAKPVGASVAQGEFLGIVGSSGNSTGPHLHLELYAPGNQLRDPFQGTCNTLNSESYWQNQLPYRDSKINKLMTHSAPPNFSTCPNPEAENEKNAFQPGEQLIVASYYHDQSAGQVSQLSIVQPDGTVASNWNHTSPNTYNASYWFWTLTIPQGVPSGRWKFRVVYQTQTYEHTFTIGASENPLFDFDGDGKADISIFRPAGGEWWFLRSSDGGNYALQFGLSSDKTVPADYTGDGKADVAVYRPAAGEWYILRSEDFSYYAFPLGISTDTPVPADYDGDGKADPAVFRASTGTWYIINSITGNIQIENFGIDFDRPVPADYDGDGKTDIAVYRPTGGNSPWWIKRSSDGSVYAVITPTGMTTPLMPGDFTGDGKADYVYFFGANNGWYVLRSEDLSTQLIQFGETGDILVPGDYDGDGKFDTASFRPSNNTWNIRRSSDGVTVQQTFGSSGDIPIPNTNVR